MFPLIVILFIIIFITALVQGKKHPAGQEQTATNATKSQETSAATTSVIEKSSSEAATTITEKAAQLETSADGSPASITTENGLTIDLTSSDIQKETSADGSVTYKMTDGSEVIVHSDGSAVVKNTILAADAGSVSSQTTVAATQSTTVPTVTTATTKSAATPKQTEASTTAPAPTEPATPAPTPSPVPTPTQPELPTPPCSHTSITKKITTPATATSNGAWQAVCNSCGQITETGVIHSYSAYQVDIGNGNTGTVYGWYDENAASELYRLLNEYRQENGLSPLENRFHNESNIRAAETAYYYSHTRPNGGTAWDFGPQFDSENIAEHGFLENAASVFMSLWKNSPGHNLNMLTEDELVGIGVFYSLHLDSNGIPNSTTVCAVQNFGSDLYE